MKIPDSRFQKKTLPAIKITEVSRFLKIRIWNMGFGNYRLEFGIWNLESTRGVCKMTTRACPSCGTKDYGTPFCVACQQPILRKQPDPPGMVEIQDLDQLAVVKAGFFRRFAAFAIDWLVLSILADIFRFVYTFGSDADPGMMQIDVAMALSTIIFLLYFTLFIGEGGQTLGKMLLGIKVQSMDGSSLGYRRAFLRSLGYVVSIFFMTFLGFLWALWDKEKQAWHDKIAGTEVIRA